MAFLAFGTGLIPDVESPAEVSEIDDVATEECAVRPPIGRALPVTPLVEDGELVAKGAAVACLRHAPDVCFVSPVGARVARVSLLPGRRLSEIILFRETVSDTQRHDTSLADTEAGLRHLMQSAGVWPWLRRRPFGGMPAHDERPAAIMVMAADTRPHAPDPITALAGREAQFSRGLAALTMLTDGPVFVCQMRGKGRIALDRSKPQIRLLTCGRRHPHGLPGLRMHEVCPAGLETPVWDIHAEDAAELGALIETGILPMRRLVRVAGPALREGRMVRTHPGADLRQLTHRYVEPGQHVVLSGSALDGQAAQWLAPRHRQVSVLPRPQGPHSRPHWLVAALTRSATHLPAIPTAALTQAFGGTLPALPFIRALTAGDDETAMALGVLSLLEEDLALADYVLGGDSALAGTLRAMLDRIAAEYVA